MNPTVTLNFGDVPTDDEYTLGFGFDGWSESKESESGALPTMTTQRQIENIWAPNGENIALTSAINQSEPVPPTGPISKDTSVLRPPEPSEVSRTPSSTPPPSPGRTLKQPKAPKKKPVITAVRKTRSMTLLDSALQTLGTLKLSLQDEVKELEMTLQTVHQSCEQAEASLKSQRPTLTRLSSTTKDSLPTNNLFAASPVYATKEGYFQHCGCSGSTDPLAPERLALRLKRQETKQFTQNPLETNGGMDIQDNL
jgi:hypothetical protein